MKRAIGSCLAILFLTNYMVLCLEEFRSPIDEEIKAEWDIFKQKNGI
jgi:hypothetical protein